MRTIDNIDKELLVDLLTTATFGSDWLEIKTLKSEKDLDANLDETYLQNRCMEERWADRLLNGGHIICIDWYDYETDENGNDIDGVRYKLTLEDFKKGLLKAKEKEAMRDWVDFVEENDDYYTCNNLVQVVIFGEVIY